MALQDQVDVDVPVVGAQADEPYPLAVGVVDGHGQVGARVRSAFRAGELEGLVSAEPVEGVLVVAGDGHVVDPGGGT